MKKLTLLVLIGMAIMSYAQPAPELLYYKTQPNPAFISVSGLTMDFVDSQDYLFTYTSEMRCAGTYQILNDPNFVMAFGKDQWDPGFDFREKINIGIYDAQTDTFFELEGEATDWNGTKTDMIWMSLNLLKFEVSGIGKDIELIIDEGLAAPVLEISGESTWNVDTQNENYYFKVSDKNIKAYAVTASQSGELIETKRWFNGMWNNYQYTPDPHVKNVTFTVVGQSKWSNEILQAQKSVSILRNDDPDPEPGDEVIIADNEYFTITIKPFRNFGNFTFIKNKANDKLGLSVIHIKQDGSKTKSDVYMKKGEEKRMLQMKGYTSFQVGWIKIGWNDYINLNKTYTL